MTLEEEGFSVVTALDFHGAVKALDQCDPALILLDLTLPRESGFELCEHVRRQIKLNHVPLLVMSDRSSPMDMAHAERVGANAYLKKPFTRPRLVKYIESLLYGPHSSRPSVRRLRPSDLPPKPT